MYKKPLTPEDAADIQKILEYLAPGTFSLNTHQPPEVFKHIKPEIFALYFETLQQLDPPVIDKFNSAFEWTATEHLEAYLAAGGFKASYQTEIAKQQNEADFKLQLTQQLEKALISARKAHTLATAAIITAITAVLLLLLSLFL